jgi:hypothetical protein
VHIRETFLHRRLSLDAGVRSQMATRIVGHARNRVSVQTEVGEWEEHYLELVAKPIRDCGLRPLHVAYFRLRNAKGLLYAPRRLAFYLAAIHRTELSCFAAFAFHSLSSRVVPRSLKNPNASK